MHRIYYNLQLKKKNIWTANATPNNMLVLVKMGVKESFWYDYLNKEGYVIEKTYFLSKSSILSVVDI